MNDKLTDYIKVYGDVLSESACKAIIDTFEAHRENVEYYDTDLYKFNQLELNRVPDLHNLTMSVAQRIKPFYQDYFHSLGMDQFVDMDKWEAIRIKKYLKGTDEQFKLHVDVTDHASAARFAVAILYLNDNDGYTAFPSLGVAVEPKPGRLIIFPPTWQYPHYGAKPTNNDKYILMTCLHYK